jgi:hypothetical protein
MINEVEAEMLRRQAEREERARREYDATFHPKQKPTIITDEMRRKMVVNLMKPQEEPKIRKVVMFTEQKEVTYDNLKHCASMTGLPYQKVKGALKWKHGLPYGEWQTEVFFKFIYVDGNPS